MARFRMSRWSHRSTARGGFAGVLVEGLKAASILSGLLVLMAAGRWNDQTKPTAATETPTNTIDDNQEPIHGLWLSRDEQRLLLTRRCGQMYVVDNTTRSVVEQDLGWQWKLSCASLSPDGQTVVAGMSDGTLSFLSPGDDVPVWWLDHSEHVRSVSFSPDGTRLASGGLASIKLWDLRDRRCLAATAEADVVKAVSFSPDGERIVGVCGMDTVRVWNAADLKPLLTYRHSARVINAVFAGDGDGVVSADCTGGLSIHSVDGRTAPWQSERICGDAWGMAVSPDGKTLAISEGYHHSIWLFSLEERLPVGQLWGHRLAPRYLQFSADGNRLYSGSYDGSQRSWEVGDLLRQAPSRYGITVMLQDVLPAAGT